MAAMLTKPQAQSMLSAISFDNAHSNFRVACMEFQRANNLEKKALAVDGDFGPKTSDALRRSYARHLKGQPTMSAHFSYSEVHCKGPPTDAGCRRISMLRVHVRRLEAYRAKIGNKPVRIMSGYRCRLHNARVGGAKSSQHMFGAATDVEGLASLTEKEHMRLFAGLGFKNSNHKVVHLDSRDHSPLNPTHGTPTNPTEWRYAS